MDVFRIVKIENKNGAVGYFAEEKQLDKMLGSPFIIVIVLMVIFSLGWFLKPIRNDIMWGTINKEGFKTEKEAKDRINEIIAERKEAKENEEGNKIKNKTIITFP